MTPLFWNLFIVWSLCAILGVEYCAILVEREERQRNRDRGVDRDR